MQLVKQSELEVQVPSPTRTFATRGAVRAAFGDYGPGTGVIGQNDVQAAVDLRLARRVGRANRLHHVPEPSNQCGEFFTVGAAYR